MISGTGSFPFERQLYPYFITKWILYISFEMKRIQIHDFRPNGVSRDRVKWEEMTLMAGSL